jgi:hypothetical protein
MAKRIGSSAIGEPGGHAIYVSKPAATTQLIETAAKGVSARAA